MDKKLLSELEQKLIKEKELLEKELSSFADKDKNLKGDWDTRFPYQGTEQNRETGGSALEEMADEVEEYGNLLPIEYNLELKLRDINIALEKIKKGTYGICEKCGKKISIERLKAWPEARLCQKCQQEKRKSQSL